MGVYVLGMHRSGTSAVTRIINAVGVPLGDPTDAISPADDNPDGFAESRTLATCNDYLLETFDGRWDAPPTLRRDWAVLAPVAVEVVPAGRLFAGVYGGDKWVWKDPRTCLTAPFWDRAIAPRSDGRSHKIVLVFRNPLAVARSLRQRDSLSKTYSLALWERYCRAALGFAGGRPTLVADFDRITGDAPFRSAWLAELAAFVDDETEPPAPADPASLLDAGLVHHALDEDALERDHEVSPEQRALYRALRDLPVRSSSLPAPSLPDETARTEQRFAEHQRCDPDELCVHCKVVVGVPSPH